MPQIRVIYKREDLLEMGAKRFLDYIAPIIRERPFIGVQKVPTLAQERKYLKNWAEQMENGELIKVVIMDGDELAGVCDVIRDRMMAQRGNVHFGLSVSRALRSQGWGEKLMREAMRQARKRMKPHRMWIEYVDGNVPARRLYRKLGFVQIGRLDEHHNHFGAWKDTVLMQYKPKKRNPR